MTDIVYATTNPGKFSEVSKLFAVHGITIHSPKEFNVELEVEETGKTLKENAILKAEAYLPLLPSGTIIIGDDTGIEIDALGGEPGIKVRRWKGYKMTDEEIIDYCLERMKNVPASTRGAEFKIAIAVATHDRPTSTFSGTFHTRIRIKPLPIRIPGFPFRPLIRANKPTHREQAILKTIKYLNDTMI